MSDPQPIFDRAFLKKAARRVGRIDDDLMRDLSAWINGLTTSEIPSAVDGSGQHTNSRVHVREAFRICLHSAGIDSGRIAELGGPFNSDADKFPEYEFEWLSLYPVEGREDVRVCNICEADHVPSESYDAIMSVSVMEHVSEPWRAAEHMLRLVKPGGIIFHSAPFSYFYHGAPADFWRYTPGGFSALFPTLKPIMSEFYGGSRRRDNRGSKSNRVDRDGGAEFAPDAFGGWRENWTTIFCGQKCPDHMNTLIEQTRKQFIVDIMKRLISDGHPLSGAARVVTDGLRVMEVGTDLKLRLADPGGGFRINPSYCRDLFLSRKSHGVDVSYNCFAAWERFKFLIESMPTEQAAPKLPGRGSATIRAMIRVRAELRQRLRR